MSAIGRTFLSLFICSILFISGCYPLSQPFSSYSLSCDEKQTVSISVIKMDLWKDFTHFLSFSTACIVSVTAFAAAPEQGWEELCKGASKKMEGPKLTIKWSDKSQPQAIGWIGSTQCTKISSKITSITIERIGIGELPNRLLVVPQNTSLQPKILDISKSQKELNFSTEKIGADEIWLWGNTLKSPCKDGCRNEQANEINVSYHQSGRFISKSSGVFLLKLNKSLHQHPLSFFGSETSLHRISINGFQQMTTNILKPKEKTWGASYEAKVKFSNDKFCPVY